MLSASYDELLTKADTLHSALAAISNISAEVREGESYSGGGSLPGEAMRTYVVAVRTKGGSVDTLAAQLRANDPPIVARIADDALLLDLRTLTEADVAEIVAAFQRLVP